MSFNPLTPKSDWHLFSPYKITPDSNIKVMRIREMINKKKLLIVKQILFQNLKKCVDKVWRICILILGCKGLIITVHKF